MQARKPRDKMWELFFATMKYFHVYRVLFWSFRLNFVLIWLNSELIWPQAYKHVNPESRILHVVGVKSKFWRLVFEDVTSHLMRTRELWSVNKSVDRKMCQLTMHWCIILRDQWPELPSKLHNTEWRGKLASLLIIPDFLNSWCQAESRPVSDWTFQSLTLIVQDPYQETDLIFSQIVADLLVQEVSYCHWTLSVTKILSLSCPELNILVHSSKEESVPWEQVMDWQKQ